MMPRLLSLLLLAALLSGCSIYKMDVRQGTYLGEEALAQLKPGQTRKQVRFILGSPSIADPFHANRWDYYFVEGRLGNVGLGKRLTLFFRDDLLVGAEGDLVPPALNGLRAAAPPAAGAPASGRR
jgi:outer membrane protein assembly factor BamE